ncbi:MBL fold metallo-hydrolase [Thioalkalivibrio sp.]|uniref:MBL fold metallo-hydrolase n=1 Tax=Thioalkalivibrio sp. TaxID=2093813 RepID=UPI0012D620F8|nr:MBL fold metallo-hydrolase [Thioalkalivibrio sp.]TVP84014.1 MAG: MBL fold metallo-hydrolase [Thioalkalivibrio sp.]
MATATVEEGSIIDLGDARFEVLHLLGHAPGQARLFEPATGLLFGADAVYDGPLIADGPGMDRAAYARTLRRLRGLPVTRVHGGHDGDFDRDRLHRIIDDHLTPWDA